MTGVTFTQADLDAAKAALVSGALTVKIGDREVQYRTQKDLLALIDLISGQLNGSSTTDTNPTMIQPGFSRSGR